MHTIGTLITEDRTINPDLELFMAKRMEAKSIEVEMIPHSLAIVSLRAHFLDQTQHVIVENMSNLVDIGIVELPKLR